MWPLVRVGVVTCRCVSSGCGYWQVCQQRVWSLAGVSAEGVIIGRCVSSGCGHW